MRLLGRPPRASSRLHANENALVGPVKRRWCRLRPFAASPAVRPGAPRPWSTSYPSGYAAFACAAAEALAGALPEWQDAIRARTAAPGSYVAFTTPRTSRLGRLVGLAIATAARDDPDYRATLVAARLELRHALGLPLQ